MKGTEGEVNETFWFVQFAFLSVKGTVGEVNETLLLFSLHFFL